MTLPPAAEPAGTPLTTQPPPGHPRFPRIDALRAIAALLIVAYHLAFVTGNLTYGSASYVALALQVGVPIFFAISGFVLYRPMVAARHGAPERSVAGYFRARFLRIMPAYWVALTLAALYPGLAGVFSGDWWRYYGLLQTYDPLTQFSGLGVAWSLCVELTFYLALPLYALALKRIAGTGRHWLRVELAVLFVLSLAAIAVWTKTSLLTLPATFSWFAVGMAAAVLSVAGWDGWWAARRPALVWAVALAAGVAYGLLLGPHFNIGFVREHYRPTYMLMATLVPLLVIGPAIWGTGGLPQRLLSLRWLAWLGAISYGLYLYHLPALQAVERLGLDDIVPGRTVLSYLVVALPVTIGLAAASYYIIERPVLSLRRTPLFWPRDATAPSGRAWPESRRLLVAFGAITSAALLLYLQPVFDLGFYYDDWKFLAAFADAASGSWVDLFKACTGAEDAGRPGGCAYHASVYFLFGGDPAAYHVMSIVFLVVSTMLIYALLRRCRMGHWPALLVCVLYVVYPGSDSTRLWAISIGAQYLLGIYIGAVLLAIEGLRRRRGAAARACHALSLLLFVGLLFTYELFAPLVAVSAAFYLPATGDRRAALRRGAVDVALALAFTFYRLVLVPIDAESGFSRQRTPSESLQHLVDVIGGAWTSWHTLFVPGGYAIAAAAVALAVVVVASAIDAGVRMDVLRWLAIATGGAAFAVVAVLPYAAAEDLYVPDTFSLFNRLNIASAPAYCVVFVALVVALWRALRHWLAAAGATIVAGALVVAVAVSQVDVELKSQRVWETSWNAQQSAIAGFERAARLLPPKPVVMSFGHPLWERGFIPVFSAPWDMAGAIRYNTPVDPVQGLPFLDTAACGPRSPVVAGEEYAFYSGAHGPLYFVNAATGEARRITSRDVCEATVAEWGRPPFWGASVTGPTAR